MGILIEIILELLGEVLFQIAVELGFGSTVETFKARSNNKVLGFTSIILLALIIGAAINFLFPARIFENLPFTGLSLILSPIIVGTVMKKIGERKERKGKIKTILATFWGGATFAFVISLTRFLITKFELFGHTI